MHLVAAFGSPTKPAGNSTDMSFMFSVGTPAASVLNANEVVDSKGCDPACVSGVPSALIVEALKLAAHQAAPPAHAGTGGF